MEQRSEANGLVALQGGRQVTIRALQEGDRDALDAFGRTLPEDDLRYLEDDFRNPEIITRLINAYAAENWRQVVAVADDGTVAAYSAVRQLPGWSDHVGDIRLLVSQAWRRSGLGTAMGHAIFEVCRELGVSKMMVDMIEEQGAGRSIFERLGFTYEGTLQKHVCDREGMPHNLIVLSYFIDQH